MKEKEIIDEARKAANRSQFMSNYFYDHKSYEDGFYEGMNQALRQQPISGEVCKHKRIMHINSEIGWLCLDCRKFSDDKQTFR